MIPLWTGRHDFPPFFSYPFYLFLFPPPHFFLFPFYFLLPPPPTGKMPALRSSPFSFQVSSFFPPILQSAFYNLQFFPSLFLMRRHEEKIVFIRRLHRFPQMKEMGNFGFRNS